MPQRILFYFSLFSAFVRKGGNEVIDNGSKAGRRDVDLEKLEFWRRRRVAVDSQEKLLPQIG
jgi:hypothetical protein